MVSSFPSAPAVVLSVREVKVKSAFEIGEKMRTRKKDVFDFVCKGRIPYMRTVTARRPSSPK